MDTDFSHKKTSWDITAKNLLEQEVAERRSMNAEGFNHGWTLINTDASRELGFKVPRAIA